MMNPIQSRISNEDKANALFTIAEFIDVNGDILLWDDRKDWGYFSYYNRRKGDPAIGYGLGIHPSPFHHWQLGFLLKLIAQGLSYVAIAHALADSNDSSNNISNNSNSTNIKQPLQQIYTTIENIKTILKY